MQTQNQRQLRARGSDVVIKRHVIKVAPQRERERERETCCADNTCPLFPHCEHGDLICITGSLLLRQVLGQVHSIQINPSSLQ